MKPKGLHGFSTCSKLSKPTQPQLPRFMTRGATSFTLHPLNFNRLHFPSTTTTTTTTTTTSSLTISNSSSSSTTTTSRRLVLLTPLLATGASFLLSSSASFSKADEAKTNSTPTPPPPSLSLEEEEAGIGWRIYDATAIGEPMAVGKEKRRVVWEKVMNARIVYLGEAEQVPTKDDKVLELEILMGLTKRCAESAKSVSLALEAFPSDLQPQLDQFLDKR